MTSHCKQTARDEAWVVRWGKPPVGAVEELARARRGQLHAVATTKPAMRLMGSPRPVISGVGHANLCSDTRRERRRLTGHEA